MGTPHVVVIDEGTTSTRAVIFDQAGAVLGESSRKLAINAPAPNIVEQDAQEMLDASLEVLKDVLAQAGERGQDVAVLGLSNQRTTTVLWDKATGRPAAPIVSWQDTRAEKRLAQIRAEWAEPTQQRTGLQLQTANVALHLGELLKDPELRSRAEAGELLAGTPDTWLIWSLTGGPRGGRHVTSASNAGSAGGYDLVNDEWWPEFFAALGVPTSLMAQVLPDDAEFGITDAELVGAALPIRSAFADQQAALFGHGGFEAGAAKCTHGTGSFVDVNVGEAHEPLAGLDLRIGWRLGDGTTRYVYEGNSFVTGSAIDWLVDGLGVLEAADRLDAVCAETPTGNGVIVVPALAGFTAPHWDQSSRGSVFGLHRGTTQHHLVRATVDGIAATVGDFIRFMAESAGTAPSQINADGGLARSDALLQSQADLSGVPVLRAVDAEYVTARGAAWMAGVAAGVWESKESAARAVGTAQRFEPSRDPRAVQLYQAAWEDAVQRTLGWHHEPLQWKDEA